MVVLNTEDDIEKDLHLEAYLKDDIIVGDIRTTGVAH